MRKGKKLSYKNKKRMYGELCTQQDIIDAEIVVIKGKIENSVNEILEDTIVNWEKIISIDPDTNKIKIEIQLI